MLISDDLPSLQRQVDRLRKKFAEGEGARNAILKSLKKKYNVETIKEAKKLHEQKLKKTHNMLDPYLKHKKEFEDKYGDRLKTSSD